EHFAAGVEIEAPGIGRAPGEDFEDLLGRMIAPDAAVEGNSLVVGRSRLADFRRGQDAVATIEPTVRPPDERVEDVVLRVQAPAVEQDFRRPGGLVLTGLDRDEDEIRRRAQPDAAKPERDPAQVGAVVEEDRSFVEMTGAL